MSSYTRRSALALMAAGGTLLAFDSASFDRLSADRNTTVSVGSDDSAIVRLSGFEGNTVYTEPHDVVVRNETGTRLTGTNRVSTVDSRLKFRETENDSASDTLPLGTLDRGEEVGFQVVTAVGENGEVTDETILELAEPGELSVRIERSLTVEFNQSARLVYGLKSDMRVYDAVQDGERDPPDTGSVDAVGATVADVTGDGTVDIPFVDSKGLYVTSVGASGYTEIPKGNKPKIERTGTRLAVGEWQPADLSGPLVLFADKNAGKIHGANGDGTTEELLATDDGTDGVSGVADLDGDGGSELVFLDGSQQLRYLNQDGTIEKITNGGVGANNSAGFGPPADCTGDGTLRVPIVDGSNNVALIDAAGNKTVLVTEDAKKAAVAPMDVDLDGDLEVAYLGNDGGNVKYVDDVGGANETKFLTVDGSRLSPDEKIGLNAGTKLDG